MALPRLVPRHSLLTALGSISIPAAPDNSLFWDRLPMTIAFMGLVASQIVDRIDIRADWPALVPGCYSGAVGHLLANHGMCRGVGNVLPYGILPGLFGDHPRVAGCS